MLFGNQPEIKYLGLRDNDLTLLDPLFGLMLRDVDLRGNDRILCVDLDRLDEIQGEGVVQRPDPCFAPNTPPEVSISSPTPPVTVAEGDVLVLEALALDAEDGDISDAIQWVSQLDGDLGGGSSLRVALTPGNHLLAAIVYTVAGAGTRQRWQQMYYLDPTPFLRIRYATFIASTGTTARSPSAGRRQGEVEPSGSPRATSCDIRIVPSLSPMASLSPACRSLSLPGARRRLPWRARPRTALLLQAQSGRRRRQL